ncbi:GntR family transcriptional regulator [Nonomuraea ceibae]|uniref:GntR family transcriptional regulator n=1 Tax=Nonomuraea ceibae TaxID=1935170 RepID=UPI001C607B4B|nr:GntR family transcriptional regulator [Nonomuraea ceibae]
MTIDPGSYTPVYVQLADIIRERIARGQYAPGQILPSEQQLIQEFLVARVTVRKALAELKAEGLVVTKPRQGTYVREEADRDAVVVEGEADVIARMPTPDERRKLGIPAGVPVLVVEREGQAPAVLPADRKIVRLRCKG